MPYKFETNKTKIPQEHDRRVKLTLEDKEEIKEMKFEGEEDHVNLNLPPNRIVNDGKCYGLKEIKQEPKKTLWDKVIIQSTYEGSYIYKHRDVKETLKNIENRLVMRFGCSKHIRGIIEQETSKELLK